MRLASYERDNTPQPAVVRDRDLVDIPEVRSLAELISLGEPGLSLASAALTRPASRSLDGARLLAPIPAPSHCLMAIGWNYRAHFDEGVGRRNDDHTELPEFPAATYRPIRRTATSSATPSPTT
jgi:hypothetical protein